MQQTSHLELVLIEDTEQIVRDNLVEALQKGLYLAVHPSGQPVLRQAVEVLGDVSRAHLFGGSSRLQLYSLKWSEQ